MGADLNNTKLDNSKICVTQLPEGYYQSFYSSDHEEIYTAEPFPVNARFADTQFRRADMTFVHFGGSMSDWDCGDSTTDGDNGGQYIFTAGCYRLELSCMNFRGAALTLADLSDSHLTMQPYLVQISQARVQQVLHGVMQCGIRPIGQIPLKSVDVETLIIGTLTN